MSHDLKIVDKSATTWFINTGAFRIVDPSTGHAFEPGAKYRIRESEWMAGQPTIVETDEDTEVAVLEPKTPGSPIISLDGSPVEQKAVTKETAEAGKKGKHKAEEPAEKEAK